MSLWLPRLISKIGSSWLCASSVFSPNSWLLSNSYSRPIEANNSPYYLEPLGESSLSGHSSYRFLVWKHRLHPPCVVWLSYLPSDVPPHDLIARQEAQPTDTTNSSIAICSKTIRVPALCVLSMLDDYDMVYGIAHYLDCSRKACTCYLVWHAGAYCSG